MTFLALVLALALQQVLSPGSVLRSRGWLLACDDVLRRHIAAATPRILVLLAVLLLVLRAVLEELADWSFGLPELLASAALLLWSLGREDYHTVLERLAARGAADLPAEDDEVAPYTDEQARAIAADLWMPPADRDSARQRLLYAGFSRWFAPLLYFALLGPLAALAYRALAVLTARTPDDTLLRLLWLLDWVPARLLAMTFALAGDFLAVAGNLREADILRASTAGLLEAGAVGACGRAGGARAIGDLLYRCAGLWLLTLSAAILLF